MKLAIVIPAYNEEKRIVRTLDNTIAYLEKQDYNSEITVVCDGSRDNTEKVVNGYRSTDKVHVRALSYQPNQGKGYAVRFGMLRSSGDCIMFMDADYAVPMEDVEKGLKLLARGYDIAIGSRSVKGAKVKAYQNFARALSAKVYTLIQNTYLGIRYGDTQCGFKLFTSEAANDLFSRQKLSSVIYDPEILWLAKQRGYKVAEFPVQWSHVEDSQIVYDSLEKSLFVFKELFRIRSLHR